MLVLVMSVYDSAVGTFSPPFTVRALGQALRSFGVECRNPDSNLARSPKDYTLFHLGHFDDEKGLVSPFDAPRAILTALEAVKAE